MKTAQCDKIAQLCEGGRLTPPFRVRYEDEFHQYYLAPKGTPNPEFWLNVPSVTQVVDQLHNFGDREPGRAADRGTIIHKACELFIKGTLDWDTVDASILPEVETFAAWWKESRFKPLLVEEVVGSWRYRFAGRLDLFGIWKTGLALIDFKTGGEYPPYAVQTAGLEIALRESLADEAYTFIPPIQRYCLYLKGDKARPVRHENPRDKTTFLAALTCSHYRRETYP